MFYAFVYADGRHTTTGDDGRGHPVCIAGQLYAFETAGERDNFTAHPHNQPETRRRDYAMSRQPCDVARVTTRAMPWGWNVKNALVRDGDYWYPRD